MTNLPPEPQRGGLVRDLWKAVTPLIAAVRELQGAVRRISDTLARVDSGRTAAERFPFAAYITPLSRIPNPSEDDVADWARTIRIRHGYVNMVKTEGCDDWDEEGVTPATFIVPAGTEAYYIWCDLSDAAAPELQHSTAATTHWEGFPDVPSTIRPIVRVSTATTPTKLRQLQWGDIWPGGGTGQSDWG